MAPGEFDRMIERSTRFSRWLRFYDKQIGKATNLENFYMGLEKLLRLWTEAAHYPKEQLRADLYTVVDESRHKKFSPTVAYNRVKVNLIEPLQKEIGVPITLSFKRDNRSICHARYLETEYSAMLFEAGFAFLWSNGGFRRGAVKPDGGCASQLEEYRGLFEFRPSA
jgi:hypothetical protein